VRPSQTWKANLESASNWLEALQAEGKVSLKALCELSEEIIAEREATQSENAEVEAGSKRFGSRRWKLRDKKGNRRQIALKGTAVQLRDADSSSFLRGSEFCTAPDSHLFSLGE